VVWETVLGPLFGLVNLSFVEANETWIGKINNSLSLIFE